MEMMGESQANEPDQKVISRKSLAPIVQTVEPLKLQEQKQNQNEVESVPTSLAILDSRKETYMNINQSIASKSMIYDNN